ncbi:MAG: hypothetical protein ACFCGT_27010 [Sandaracinaceae bacterium]
MRPLSLIALGLLATGGCDDIPDNDARLLLDRAQHIDVSAPIADRRQDVERLSRLPLSSPRSQALRDLCVRAHRAMIEVEDAHGEVRAGLERYGGDEAAIPEDERRQLSEQLEAADRRLGESRALFTECQGRLRELERSLGATAR